MMTLNMSKSEYFLVNILLDLLKTIFAIASNDFSGIITLITGNN